MVRNKMSKANFIIKKLRHILVRHGFSLFSSIPYRLYIKIRLGFNSLLYPFFMDKKIITDMFSQEYDFIDFSCGKIQWEGALLQRYRQIATNFSHMNGLVIAGSLPQVDKIDYVIKKSQNLYVINPFVKSLVADIENILSAQKKPVLVRVQSTDFSVTYEQILHWQKLGFVILYEYIDPFHEEISGPIPVTVMERHLKIIQNESVYICASAKALLHEIPAGRERTFLSPNASDPRHWQIHTLKQTGGGQYRKVKAIKSLGKPILAYHGAMASWLDYELLTKIASDGRYSLLLIGVEYDNSLRQSGLLGLSNVYYIGPVDYNELPFVATLYDVSLIPFKRNELSDGVSPIKLFEYMSIGKPIVVTTNKEIKQYKSCLHALDSNDFISQINIALSLKEDEKYISVLMEEAKANSWEKRCRDILSCCMITAHKSN